MYEVRVNTVFGQLGPRKTKTFPKHIGERVRAGPSWGGTNVVLGKGISLCYRTRTKVKEQLLCEM